MARVYNFSPGPAALPTPVLEQVQHDLVDWRGRGYSVLETSHRSEQYEEMAAQTEADLRDVMNIPDNYKTLFLPGGARVQFSTIPMNLCRERKDVDYFDTGFWSDHAITMAQKYCKVHIVASSRETGYDYIPAASAWQFSDNPVYVHYTPNETIHGTEFNCIPETGSVPLIADMTSSILSEPIDITKFALVYAASQKNIAPAGMTIVIIREDLIYEPMPETPPVYNFQLQAKHSSRVSTPPVYAIYIAGLVFKWIKELGGLDAMGQINQRKASNLYQCIDNMDFYQSDVKLNSRSRMNVIFKLPNEQLEEKFLTEAEQAGFVHLKGHRKKGGIRASIYNAMPEEGVNALCEFMKAFAASHGANS